MLIDPFPTRPPLHPQEKRKKKNYACDATEVAIVTAGGSDVTGAHQPSRVQIYDVIKALINSVRQRSRSIAALAALGEIKVT